MKNMSIIHDVTIKRHYLQTPLDKIEKHREEIEDMLDAIIADQRRHEPTVSLEDLKKRLKRAGKL